MAQLSLSPPPEAILFDHDGTLVASEPLHWIAWLKLFEEIKLAVTEKQIRAWVGRTAPEILRYFLEASPAHQSWLETSRLNELVERKNQHYVAQLSKGLNAYPGVESGLKRLHAMGIRMGVVSNARSRELRLGLERKGLLGYFEVIVSREDVRACKPDPEHYRAACRELGLAPGPRIWALEDSPTGLRSALGAGLTTIGLLTNFERTQLEQPFADRPELRTDHIFESIGAFFETLLGA